jgi:hypothetical protein
MRKHILSLVSLFAAVLLVTSCGAQKKDNSTSVGNVASVSGPSVSQWRAGVKGKWVLNSVVREDIPQNYVVKNIFDEAPVDCFIGSVWDLPEGYQRGSITFHTSGTLCADGAIRTIVWSIYNPGKAGEPEFQFKKIYAGDKPSNVLSGYRLKLSYADKEKLVLKMPVNLSDGAIGYLVFTFNKAV